MALFADMAATAELFRTVRWAGGRFCPRCSGADIARYCRYRGRVRRYTCRGCSRTFNDKTGTILHYRHVRMGDWMLTLRMLLCGPPNWISIIYYIATSLGRAYGAVYRTIRDIMRRVSELPEGKLSGTGETDEEYIRPAPRGCRWAATARAGSYPAAAGCRAAPAGAPSRRSQPRRRRIRIR